MILGSIYVTLWRTICVLVLGCNPLWVLVGLVWFGCMPFDFILAHYSLELIFPLNFFTSSVVYHFIRCTVFFYKLVLPCVTILLSIYWIGLHKLFFVDEYLQVIILMYRLAPCIHCVGWHCSMYSPHIKNSVDFISSSKWYESRSGWTLIRFFGG